MCIPQIGWSGQFVPEEEETEPQWTDWRAGMIPGTGTLGELKLISDGNKILDYPVVSGSNAITSSHLNDSAIKRILEYLMMEDAESDKEPAPSPAVRETVAIALLRSRAEELRRESSAISLLGARAKRDFAAGILEQIIEELSQ